MNRPTAAAFALLVTAAAALAQEGPSFDCEGELSGADKLVCADPALAALDRQLAARFEAARTAVEAAGGDAEAAEEELRGRQRDWVATRDACAAAAEPVACLRDAYLARDAELVARYGLAAPISLVSWRCDGEPALMLATAFFDTDPGSVRIDDGTGIDIGLQAVAASGVRYETLAGRELWTKGNEASYRVDGPDGAARNCTVIAPG